MKKYLTPESMANEIRMSRGQYKGTFLIVEGSTDAILFERLMEKKCKVVASNGKDNAIKIIEILDNSNFKGVLAVVDADFWVIDDVVLPSPNIVITDAHDLETMLIFSDALDRVLDEFGSSDVLDGMDTHIRELLVRLALPIGYFRLISSRAKDHVQLKFQGIRYSDFLDVKTSSIDVKRMVVEVLRNSGKIGIEIESLFEDISFQVNSEIYERKHVCHGDDLLEILALGMKDVFGNFRSRELNTHSLRAILRLAYDKGCFNSTELFKSLVRWQSFNPSFSFL